VGDELLINIKLFLYLTLNEKAAINLILVASMVLLTIVVIYSIMVISKRRQD